MKSSSLSEYLQNMPREALEELIKMAEGELSKRQPTRGFEIARGFEGQVKYMPQRATPCSAGYDFWPLEEITLHPGESYAFYTGIKAYMPENEVLLVNIRSSYGIKYGIELCNEQGWIDADYYSNPGNDGVIIVKVKNSGRAPFTFRKEEPFAQGMFITYHVAGSDSPRLEERSGGTGHSSGRISS